MEQETRKENGSGSPDPSCRPESSIQSLIDQYPCCPGCGAPVPNKRYLHYKDGIAFCCVCFGNYKREVLGRDLDPRERSRIRKLTRFRTKYVSYVMDRIKASQDTPNGNETKSGHEGSPSA